MWGSGSQALGSRFEGPRVKVRSRMTEEVCKGLYQPSFRSSIGD